MKLSASLSALALVAAIAAPMSAQAHRGWMAPTSTVLSGEDAWIGVDGGASNGVFIADHAPLRLDNLVITAPDGSTVQPENTMVGKYRSTFDVHLTRPGTYRIASVGQSANATWTLNGQPGRWRGRATELAANIPAGATDVVSAVNSNRLETFVTLGEPSTQIFAPTGQGVEMVPVTHPNDLVAEEAATFQLLKDGQPLANADVTIARGGTRYRDNPEEMTVKTAADGRFTVTWPEPGMYWVNTVVRAGGPEEDHDEPRGAGPQGARGGGGRGGPPVASAQWTAVLEVLP